MKRALVVGCAACVWKDVLQAQKLCHYDTIICVKMAGVYWPGRFHIWAGVHPEYMADYIQKRRRRFPFSDSYEIVAPLESELDNNYRKIPVDRRVSYHWGDNSRTGSSGLYGVKVAINDEHTHVVLAGIPMDGQKHFTRGKSWIEGASGSYRHGWIDALPYIKDRVRSVSGWTKELLGQPTPEWIANNATALH